MWYAMFLFFVLYGIALFGLHSAACGMHAIAIEQLWRHNPATRNEYVWSHTYCKIVAYPLERLM